MVYVCMLTSHDVACLWLITESFLYVIVLLDCANCLLSKAECCVD